MRNRFDRELDALFAELIEMGNLIEAAISEAVEALCRRDPALARRAVERDEGIDEKERSIERRCLRLLLEQQPVAADLRLISTALKMITDMERIGDHAADLGELTLLLAGGEYTLAGGPIPRMAKTAIEMVKQSIDAFARRDAELAKAVIARDDEVDGLFDEVRRGLIERIQSGGTDGEQLVDLLLAAKYFERIADHAVNIAEWDLFSITGVRKGDALPAAEQIP